MSKPFFAARIEDKINRQVGKVVRSRGWSERITPYTGYGSSKFVRILARVLLASPKAPSTEHSIDHLLDRRGWRNFFSTEVINAPVRCTIAGESYEVSTDRNGYVDVRLPVRGLTPGWHDAVLECGDAEPTAVPIMVIDPEQDYGIVSDIDDTIISTSLPRPMIAAWNTFVLHESARQAVPGMADLYQRLLADHPEAPIVYVSTGSWNTAPTLNRFMRHHNFPIGPMLLTDWGPTNSGWFRSGQEHKRTCLRDLAIDFPKIRWILIGDDGQHDPTLYGEFAEAHPDRCRVIGLRQLTTAEQVLAHGTTQSLEHDDHDEPPSRVPEVRAEDGHQLRPLLEEALAETAERRLI